MTLCGLTCTRRLHEPIALATAFAASNFSIPRRVLSSLTALIQEFTTIYLWERTDFGKKGAYPLPLVAVYRLASLRQTAPALRCYPH